MRVLAIDTATAATAVALRDEAHAPPLALEARDDPPPGARPGHTPSLLRLVEEVLEPGGGWEALDRLAVGVGPGSFTGLRIGIATAQALARARDIELVGVSTLAALALTARDRYATEPVLAVIDARRGEAFVAAWEGPRDPLSDAPQLPPAVLSPDALAAFAGSLPGAVAVGDGAIKFAGQLRRAGVTVPAEGDAVHRISALSHCRLAVSATPVEPAAVQPTYLRLADAEIARRP